MDSSIIFIYFGIPLFVVFMAVVIQMVNWIYDDESIRRKCEQSINTHFYENINTINSIPITSTKDYKKEYKNAAKKCCRNFKITIN
jgi:hypothetical protein